MKWCALPVVALFLSSCDRTDYVINIKSVHITQVSKDAGSGYIIVDKLAADNMIKYGDIYIDAKFCPEISCKEVSIGRINKDHQESVKGDIKLNADFYEFNVAYDYPQFWLNDIACLKINAVQGFMGREGKSGWYCNIQKDIQSGSKQSPLTPPA